MSHSVTVKGVVDTGDAGLAPLPAARALAPAAVTPYAELKTRDREVKVTLGDLLRGLIQEVRALRKNVCAASGQLFAPADNVE